jgi:hypothetical protein
VTDRWDEAAQAWARGMRLSAPFVDERRRAASAKAQANRGRLGPCGIKGCKRNAYKGRLCRAHYAMVPQDERMGAALDAIQASMQASARRQRRYLRIVRDLLRAESAHPRIRSGHAAEGSRPA